MEGQGSQEMHVKMWAFPYLTIFAILGMVSIVVAMAFIPEQQTPLLFGIISLVVPLGSYVPRYFLGRKQTPATAAPAKDRG